MSDRLLPRRVLRDVGNREVDLGESLALLGDHRNSAVRHVPFPATDCTFRLLAAGLM